MTAMALHLAEDIEASAVGAAARRLGPAVLQLVPEGSRWPVAAAIEHAVVARTGKPELLHEAGLLLDRVRGSLSPFTWRGVDVLDGMRYFWARAWLPAMRTALVVGHAVAQYRPSRLLVTGASGSEGELRELGRMLGVDIVAQRDGTSRVGAQLRALSGTVRRAAYLAREELQASRGTMPSIAGPMTGSVLCPEYHPHNARSIAPVLDELAGAGCPVAFLSARREVVSAVQKLGHAQLRLHDHARATQPSWAAAAARLSASMWKQVRQLPAGLLALDGGSIAAAPLLRPAFASTLARLVISVTRAVEGTHSALDLLAPRAVVVTTNTCLFSRSAALTATSRGIPTAYLQHGLRNTHPYFTSFPFDLVLLWGERDRHALAEAGIAGGHVQVVGSPALDDALGRARASHLSGVRSGGIGVLLLASRAAGSSVSAPVFERTVVALAEAVASIPGARLTVKLHPSDHTGLAQRALASHSRVEIIQKGDVHELIRRCDLAVVTSSTTGLETCALDQPLVVFNLTGTPDIVGYGRYGAALVVDHEQDLLPILHRALVDETARAGLARGRRRLLDDVLAGASGDAVSRAASAIRALTSPLQREIEARHG